jgi:hypothetical protein
MWKDTVKRDLKDTWRDSVKWIHQVRLGISAKLLKFRVLQRAGNCLTS